MKKLKLGIIGTSKGNGHPYSWSAIFNGYDPKYMKNCPYPVIYDYLSKQKFPEDNIKGASVTHIWTQNKKISEHKFPKHFSFSQFNFLLDYMRHHTEQKVELRSLKMII